MADVKAPRGTGPAGKTIWASIADTFDLDLHEVELLRQIATVADRIESLDRAVTRDGILLADKVHPALIESRLQRVTLARLVGALRLPDKHGHRPQRRGGFRGTYHLRQVGGDGA